MQNNATQIIKKEETYLINLRKKLHKIPEICYEENLTSAEIKFQLDEIGVKYEHGIAGTGIIAVLKKGNNNRTIAIRADIDGLPILEEGTHEHKSQFCGKMHACGHDGHSTILIGAIRKLKEEVNFNGSIAFIFQPAEEGGAGAKKMIEEGIIEKYKIESIFSLHNWPDFPVGTYGIKSGPIMASSDEFTIKINGTGGHAALPHLAKNPINLIPGLIEAINRISIEIKPVNEPSVITISVVNAGTIPNVIPNMASIKGTIRSVSKETRNLIKDKILEITEGLSIAYKINISLSFNENGYPAVFNSKEHASICVQATKKMIKKPEVKGDFPSSMGSDDFGFFLEHLPGCYVLIGNGKEHGNLHSPSYDFNDEIIPQAVDFWANLAMEALNHE